MFVMRVYGEFNVLDKLIILEDLQAVMIAIN